MATNPSTDTASGSTVSQPWLKAHRSRYFLDWLAEHGVSLAFTTYQTGKLFFVGRKSDRSLSMFERTYNHCMGMWASPDGKTIWLSSRYQIWKMVQVSALIVPHQLPDPDNEASAMPAWEDRGYYAAYIPRVGYTTQHPQRNPMRHT